MGRGKTIDAYKGNFRHRDVSSVQSSSAGLSWLLP